MSTKNEDKKTIKISRPEENVLLLTLSRPKARNSVTRQMIVDICDALDFASQEKTVQAVIITGDPQGNSFCAGADLSPQTSNFGDVKREITMASFRDEGGFTSLAALRCTKPIIAAINGAAVGMGLAFPLAADIRVVSEDAKVGFPMAARGLVNESISSYLLPRLVGSGFAKELVFTSRIFRAHEAPRYAPGLFNYILPKNEVLPKAIELAQEIVSNSSTLSVAMCKYLMDSGWESTPEEAMLNESKCLYYINKVKPQDVKEGVTSFLQRRKAKWIYDAWNDLPDFLPFHPKTDIRANRKRSLISKL